MRQVVALQGEFPLRQMSDPKRHSEIEVTAGMLAKFGERVVEEAGPFQGVRLAIRDSRLYAVWGRADEGLPRHHDMEV